MSPYLSLTASVTSSSTQLRMSERCVSCRRMGASWKSGDVAMMWITPSLSVQ